MSQLFFLSFIVIAAIANSCNLARDSKPVNPLCECDSNKTKNIVTSKIFNRIPQYDTSSFDKSSFYGLDSNINRMLWYRDIENPDTTKFTNLWDDYSPANYHASHLDFVKYYQGRNDIELAFQLGPNMDLWAYHIFVIKKIECCYLVTRSYFRHARFTYKAYSIMTGTQLDSLYSVIRHVQAQKIGDKVEYKYSGYFVDHRYSKNFFIDFEKEIEKNIENEEERPKKEVKALYNFLDEKIIWTKTY